MSADNFYLIRASDTEFYVTMEFASNSSPGPMKCLNAKTFKTFDEAMDYASNEYSEYGVRVGRSARKLLAQQRKRIPQMVGSLEAKLAARLLREASEQYSNHGCNDWMIDDTPENHAFAEAIAKYQDPRDPPEVKLYEGKLIVMDFIAMDYLADLLDPDARKAGAP